MTNKLLKPVTYVATGILTLIFMALDYFQAIVTFGKEKQSEGQDAFEFIKLDVEGADSEVLKTIASVALVGIIIAAVIVLLAGIVKLLPVFGVKVDALDSRAALIDKVASIILKAMVALNVVALVCTLLFGLGNTEEVWGAKIIMTTDIGAYFLLVLAIVAVIVEKIANKKAAAEVVAEEAPVQEETTTEEN